MTNANIVKLVADNCPGAFEVEDVSCTRGFEIDHGPNGSRSVLVRQMGFTYVEIANLVHDLETAGCDVDINIGPCPEDSQLVTLEIELSPGVKGSDDWWRDHVEVPVPGIDFDKIRAKLNGTRDRLRQDSDEAEESRGATLDDCQTRLG